jgi:heme oxygenase
MQVTRRFRLRERTSHAHAAVDHLIGPFRSAADYERYVLGLYAFRIPLETKLAATAWPELFGHWRPQPIGQALRADMDDLRLTPRIVAESPDRPGGIEDLLGLLYVLEGSALGAQILYRRAQDLGFTSTCGARHLALQSGVDSWREFIAILERHEPLEFESVVAASIANFCAAEQAFTGLDNVTRQPA